MKMLRLIVPILCALLLSSALRAAPWTQDYAAAVAQAKKENKKLLLDFTGSDWCGWCMKLEEDVFLKAEFGKFADANLVLVKLDYPKKKKLPDAVRAQNAAMKEKYKIRGYPTLVLLDADEKLLMRIDGYPEGGVTPFLESMKRAIARKRE